MNLSIRKVDIGYTLLIITSLIALLVISMSSPIEQSQSYHEFSDSTMFLSIPNFWNVISNLPFTIVGFMGIHKLRQITKKIRIQYVCFFLGLIFISTGSSYYHLSPNDATLVWDRLPMTIVFMALFSIIISEFINNKLGVILLFPLLILGVISILVWLHFNDLRLYALVQFFPVVAIPIILLFFKSKYNIIIGYWIVLIAYVFAKLFEYFDYQIHEYTHVISGHSLKHIFSAIGLLALFYSYVKRKKLVIK